MLQDRMWHTVWGVRKHEFVKNLGAACTAQFPAYVQLADVLLANECSDVRGAADAIVLFLQEQYCESFIVTMTSEMHLNAFQCIAQPNTALLDCLYCI